jgi:chlorosome envelope protein C
MTETYQKLREEFKTMPLPDRIGFLVESLLLTGQSAIVGTLNVIGDVVEGATNVASSVTQSFGMGSGQGGTSMAAQTINRVVITVKDAGKATASVMKDVAKSVDSATEGIVKGVGEATMKATEVAADVISSVQKTSRDMTGNMGTGNANGDTKPVDVQ